MSLTRRSTRKKAADVDYTYLIKENKSKRKSTSSGSESMSDSTDKENKHDNAQPTKKTRRKSTKKGATPHTHTTKRQPKASSSSDDGINELVANFTTDTVIEDDAKITAYETMLAKKDKAFNDLLAAYNTLRATNEDDRQVLLEQVAVGGKGKATDGKVNYWRSQARSAQSELKATLQAVEQARDAFTQEVQEYKTHNEEMQATVTKQEGTITELKQMQSVYQLLTATQVIVKKNGKARCKVVNRNPHRVMEWELDTESADIEYKPKKIDMGGDNYPYYFKEPISFTPEETPVFMRNVLHAVYKAEKVQAAE